MSNFSRKIKNFEANHLKKCNLTKKMTEHENTKKKNESGQPVLSRTDKTFKIVNNDKVQHVAINNDKPCFTLRQSSEITAHSSIFSPPDFAPGITSGPSTALLYVKPELLKLKPYFASKELLKSDF